MRWNNTHVQRHIKGLALGELANPPRPIEIIFDEVRELPIQSGEYQNPFTQVDPLVTFSKGQEEPAAQIKIDGEREKVVNKRKWKVDIADEITRRIQSSRADYEKYLKLNNNTSNKEVWKVYDHLAADLTNELLGQIMGTIDKDLDSFCEKVIVDEFYS